MALTTNLVSYWRFDESSGNASDAVGPNTLTNNGSASFGAAKINNGAVLSAASSQFFGITDAAQTGLNPSGAAGLSFSFWTKITSAPSSGDYYAFVNKDDGGGGTNRQFEFLYFNSGGTLQIWVYAFGTSNATVFTNADFSVNLGTSAFRHIVVAFDLTQSTAATKISLYVDGVAQTPASTNTVGGGASTFGSGASSFDVGRTLDGTKYFNGTIDELGVWSRALTSTEVTSLYNSGTGFSYPFSSGTTYTPTYTEAVTIAATLLKSATRVVSEAATVTDTLLKTMLRSLSQAITVSDTIASAKVRPATFTDAVSISDALIRATTKVLSQATTISDALLHATGRTLTQALTVADMLSHALSRGITLVESITAAISFDTKLNGTNVIWTKVVKSAAATWTHITKSNQ